MTDPRFSNRLATEDPVFCDYLEQLRRVQGMTVATEGEIKQIEV